MVHAPPVVFVARLLRACCWPLQAFEGENRPPFTLCLVPWADGLNHSSGAGEDSCLAYDPDAQRATLRSHIGYRAGEEVFDSYGPWLSARQLLLDYGFVDAEQTAAIAEVPVRCLHKNVLCKGFFINLSLSPSLHCPLSCARLSPAEHPTVQRHGHLFLVVSKTVLLGLFVLLGRCQASAFGPSAGDDNRALVAAVGLPEGERASDEVVCRRLL